MESTVKERIKEVLRIKGLSVNTLSKVIGVRQNTLSRQINSDVSISLNSILLIIEKLGLSSSWLLFGEGEMFKGETGKESSTCLLPLIPIDAMAGFALDGNQGVMGYELEYYNVPDFKERNVDFLIKVSGTSMYPKYNSGDILACRKLTELNFVQWGKVYVLDTSQGVVVKRLYKDNENGDCVICHSDNEEKYPEFEMPLSEIRSIAIVVGAIKLE